MLKKSSLQSCIVGLLLTSVLNFSAVADVVKTKDADLTMNTELRKDIQQTLGYLRYQHYLPVEINDDYSSRTLDGYLKILDPNKVYFTQADIDSFEIYRYKLDDLMKQRDAEVAFDIFKIYRQRLTQRTELIMELIQSDFDFTVDETINIDRDNFTWAADEKSVKEKWRKRIKNNTLQQLIGGTQQLIDGTNQGTTSHKKLEVELIDIEQVPELIDDIEAESIREALQSITNDKALESDDVRQEPELTANIEQEPELTADEKIAEIRDNLTRRYQRQQDTIYQLKADEVFEWFMNAYTKELGPHTQYMSHATTENFIISMSLSLEGIGAALNTDEDYTVINRIIKGGPAEKSGLIKPDDKIVGVSQDGEEMINVIGWRLMDVVKMIRGKKGTKVNLQIIPADSSPGAAPELITLVRDVIELEDQAAKMTSVDVPFGESEKKFAVISIPSFYSNQGQAKNGAKFTATTHDVRKLIEDMKKQNDTEGLIIDLRGNGGGYLNEAVSLSGLFIKDGPVVQVIPSNRKTEILKDNDSDIAYDGPLMVLIDRYSASASEIFAAAMQDYGRATIVGERSFGKGTVQRVVPLRAQYQLKGNNSHNSQVKLTNAQFFRVNGGSTQHKGVTPDIILNSGIEDPEFGERAYDNALPWSETKPAQYQPKTIPQSLLTQLSMNHIERSQKSAAFSLLRKNSEQIHHNKNTKVLSLNLKERQQESDRLEAESLTNLNTYRASLGLEPVDADTRKDNPLPDDDEHWNIVYQTEAARILFDQINLSGSSLTSFSQKH